MKRFRFLPLILLLLQASIFAQDLDYSTLVSLWRLNDSASDDFSSNEGTFVGNEAYTDGPKAGMRAGAFDGKSYIKTGHDIAFDTSDSFSFTAWIKGAAQDASVGGRMHHGGTYTGYELHVHSDINVWIINSYGPSFIEVHSQSTVMDKTWHHVAYTYDGSGLGEGVRVYVDGLDSTGAIAANNLSGSILADDVEFDIGTRQDGAAHDFNGDISEVSVWKTVLSPDDIFNIFTNGIHPVAVPLISQFSADVSKIFAGAPVTLSWECDPGATLSIDQGIGDLRARTINGKGSIQVSPKADTSYTLTATKGAETLTKTVIISVPLIVKFGVDIPSVFAGVPATLSWETDPAASLSIDQGVGDVTAQTVGGKGSIQVTPGVDTIYTLTAARDGRQARQTATVQIKPLITSFQISRTKVPRGEPVIFSWTAHPEATLALSPEPGDVGTNTVAGSGSVVVTPTDSDTYTLHATRGTDTFELPIDVEVIDVLPGEAPDLSKLISFWPLDGNANDTTGANNGTFVPAERYGPGVNPGTQSGKFDGNTYIKAGQAIAFDTDSSFSFTAWIKGPPQDGAIAGRMIHGGTYRGWELHAHMDMNLWLLNNYGPSMIEVHSAETVMDNTWHHVAFTYDGSSFAGGVKIYLDGAESIGSALDRLEGSILSPEAEFNIGTRQSGTAHDFQGNIAEVSLWKTVLSSDNIANIYLNGIAVAESPRFTKISAVGTDIKIEWSGGGTLQSASTASGPWVNVATAVTPFVEARGSAAKFYRVTR
jgi:hypothetical protein